MLGFAMLGHAGLDVILRRVSLGGDAWRLAGHLREAWPSLHWRRFSAVGGYDDSIRRRQSSRWAAWTLAISVSANRA